MITTWLVRLFRWLFLEPGRVWATMIGIALPFVVFCLIFSDWEHRVRWTGLALQLLGIATVAIGLSETRKLFGRPSLLDAGREWFKRRPKIRQDVRVPITGVMATAEAGDFLSANGTVHPAPNTPLEERVQRLEGKVNELSRKASENEMALEEEKRSRATALADERYARGAGDEKVKRQLEEACVGGLYLETMGLVWLVVGVILATASVDVDKWLS